MPPLTATGSPRSYSLTDDLVKPAKTQELDLPLPRRAHLRGPALR